MTSLFGYQITVYAADWDLLFFLKMRARLFLRIINNELVPQNTSNIVPIESLLSFE
jgi:hypothetical protein